MKRDVTLSKLGWAFYLVNVICGEHPFNNWGSSLPTEIQFSRRKLLTGALSEVLALLIASRTVMADEGPKMIIERFPPPSGQETEARRVEEKQKALAAFPFERIEVPGSKALEVWTQYKQAGRGSPVVLGDENAVVHLAESFTGKYPLRSAAEIIDVANTLSHPQGLLTSHKLEDEAIIEHTRKHYKELAEKDPDRLREIFNYYADETSRELTLDDIIARMTEGEIQPPTPPTLGEWPASPDGSPGLSVASDFGREFQKVYIGIIPTDDWTTIPAHLQLGGWNACPHPEYHIAALRSWRDRYGAELIGLNFDTMNLRVARRPQMREEAIALAYEHHTYCNDVIDQGLGTVSALAAALMANDWWYFWWD